MASGRSCTGVIRPHCNRYHFVVWYHLVCTTNKLCEAKNEMQYIVREVSYYLYRRTQCTGPSCSQTIFHFVLLWHNQYHTFNSCPGNRKHYSKLSENLHEMKSTGRRETYPITERCESSLLRSLASIHANPSKKMKPSRRHSMNDRVRFGRSDQKLVYIKTSATGQVHGLPKRIALDDELMPDGSLNCAPYLNRHSYMLTLEKGNVRTPGAFNKFNDAEVFLYYCLTQWPP